MKMIDTLILKRMVGRSRKFQYNRLMPVGVEKQLDPYGKHILTHAFIHGDVQCIRCTLLAKFKNIESPYQGVLDFCIDDYNRIPEYKEEE